MAKTGWYFPPLCGGNEQGYTNSGIETFKGTNLIDNLAREICQNSLDAKNINFENPVKVKFEVKTFKKSKYNIFTEYEKCILGCKKYWAGKMDDKLKDFLNEVDSTLKEDEISVLVASDYNTIGLTGSQAERNEKSVWRALVHSDGTSVKGEGSGGSYGIGKNAPFACSSLSLVCYNTYAEDGKKAFKGVARVATLFNEQNEDTQGVGHYQKIEDNKKLSPIFEDDDCEFRNEFNREELGTDIIIVGFNEINKWKEKIEKAIIKNFFLAIKEGKLIVEIDKDIINQASIADKIIFKYANDKEMLTTKQLYETVETPDVIKKNNIFQAGDDVELYLKTENDYRKTIANFRTTGMLIGTYSKRFLQSYAAVLVVRGAELGELLRSTEPPKHDKWDYNLISKKEKIKRDNAKNAIKKINDWVVDVLKEQYETVTENEIDSEVGEYLPDEVGDFGNVQQGDDILRVKQTVASVREKLPKIAIIQDSAEKTSGTEISGDPHNKETNTRPIPTPKPPKPVDSDKEPETDGIAAGKGNKLITYPNIEKQRVFPINQEQGLYKLIVVAEKDYDKTYMYFSSVGEDGRKETLNVNYYKEADKNKCNANGIRIGPISLAKKQPKEVFVELQNKEKMLLNFVVTEEKSA